MSVIAISETVGSRGQEIGRAVASALGYEFADREIITKAAERFGGDVGTLTHVTEERPTVFEHFSDLGRRYCAYVEAVILELAARDNAVLVGRAATIVLGNTPHTLRVRISAPEALRVERVQEEHGFTDDAARAEVVRRDRERAARVRFFYHVDWDDWRLYDLVLNTDRLRVEDGARVVQTAVAGERWRSTPAGRQALLDLSLAASTRARLLRNPLTARAPITAGCVDGVIRLTGAVDAAQIWAAAHDEAAAVPGSAGVQDDLTVIGLEGWNEREELSHSGFRHGEAWGWGGYGGGWHDQEWEAIQRYLGYREEQTVSRQRRST
jgi:cytidylate kinase